MKYVRAVALFASLLACAPAGAQEFRALIYGAVTDPTGSAIPGTAITAVNVGTGVRVHTTSAADGNYVLPQLPTGNYEVNAEAAGFRSYKRQGITLNVGDKANVPIQMEVGGVSESVTVSAELTGIETNQSVMDQLMDNKKVAELPLNGRQVFMLLQLSAGVLFTQQVFGSSGFSGTRPYDVNGTVSIHGSQPGGAWNGSNAFLLDGAPLGVSGNWNYSPLVDAVDEFKVSTPTSDASQGLTGGGVVNMTMRSGTNRLHGVLSHFIRNNIFDANATQANRAAAQRPDLKNQQHQWNSFAGMLSGPVIKNKMFYAGHYEGYRERVPFPVTVTMPTLEQRQGDFSRTFNAGGQQIVVFDPLTTRQEGARFVRDPFPGNRIPDARIVPVARNMLKFIPLPNIVTNPVTFLNNFAASPNVGRFDYDAQHVKVDYIWNERHRTSASETFNRGSGNRSANGIGSGNPAKTGVDPKRRRHYGAILDHVWTASATTVLNGRLSWDRAMDFNEQLSANTFDGSQLGFPGRIGSNPVARFPNITIAEYASWGDGNKPFMARDTYSAVLDISHAHGLHFFKFGARVGQGRFYEANSGDWNGRINFTKVFTQRDPLRGDATSGNALAAFLLGYPASGGTDVNPMPAYENKFIGLYLQDDIKLSRKLTVNLGLRWDIQTAPTERFNSQIVDFDATQTYQLGGAQAQGGFIFAGPSQRRPFDTHFRDFQPRTGIAWQVSSSLVVRAGYGLTYVPLNGIGGAGGVRQSGFSRRTPLVATSGGGLNSYVPGMPGTGTLENPFPDGILQPWGSSLGPLTQVGQAINFLDRGYEIPRVHQFHVGIEYQMPWKTTVEASYVGSRTRRYPVSTELDANSLENRLKGFADPNYLNASVPNPFAGAPELAGTGLSAATITRAQSLVPFPQFTSVTMDGMPIGNSSYNALEARVNKRLTNGLTLTASYTWAKVLQAMDLREDQYTVPEHVLADFDRTHHFTLFALYQLPVGRGRAVGAHWGRALDLILGNWQYNFTLENSSGTPTAMPDAIPVLDPRLPGGSTRDRWFNTCTQLTNGQRSNCASPSEPVTWVQLKPYELRTFSSRFPNLRNNWQPQINMSAFKSFPITERVGMELRAEAFNAFNTPIYAGPNVTVTSPQFGVVVPDQQNFPRNMQFALRLRW